MFLLLALAETQNHEHRKAVQVKLLAIQEEKETCGGLALISLTPQ